MSELPPQLIGFDLDGTLLDHRSRLPQAHADVVQWLRERDITVVIVTGRPLLTTRWVYEALNLDDPLVCFNGVWVGYPDDEPIHMHALEEGEVLAIFEALGDAPGSICAYPGPHRWLMHRFTERTRNWSQLYGVLIEEDRQLLASWRGPSCKIMYVDEPNRIHQAAERLREDFCGRFHVVVSQEDRLEVTKPGMTKAEGMNRLCAHLGIAREACWVVGDAANDLEMIRWAGCGLAMGHAPEAVRAAADRVLPGIDDHGLVALRELIGRA